MPTPGEHKTVQSRILAFAEAIGWSVVPRVQAEQRRGFAPTSSHTESATCSSLYFADLLEAKVREFNPRYNDEPGALLRRLRQFQASIHGNRDFVELLRN
jgi:type I restriction enzyme R subunit